MSIPLDELNIQIEELARQIKQGQDNGITFETLAILKSKHGTLVNLRDSEKVRKSRQKENLNELAKAMVRVRR